MTGEKRSADPVDEPQELMRDIQVVVLDVEGTTTSISFVKDTLFPYVREFLKKHIDEHWDSEEFKDDLEKLKNQAKEDEENKVEGVVPIKNDPIEEAKDSLIKNILWQMDNDRKTGALKQLQGHMWKAAHKPIQGHVYDDVPKAFEEWTNQGKKLYIYSSGSVQAQKLLFGNSVHGDLLKFISGHFDTEVGAKQEAESYKNILKKIDVEPSKVLFLTDVVKEAEAAKAAGLLAALVIREGNAELSNEDKEAFLTIKSFDELPFHASNKRQKVDESSSVEEKNGTQEKEEKNDSETVSEPMDTTETPEKASAKESATDSEKKTDVEESKVEKKTDSEPEKKVEEKSEKAVSHEENGVSKEITESVKSTEPTEKSNGLHENGKQDLSEGKSKATDTNKTGAKTEIARPETDVCELKSNTKDVIEGNDKEKNVQISKDETESSTKVNDEKVKSSVEEPKLAKEPIEVAEKNKESKVTEEEVPKTCELSKPIEKSNEGSVAQVEEKAKTDADTEKVDEVNGKPTENGKTDVEIPTKKLNGTSTNGNATDEVVSNGKSNENGGAIEEDAVKVKKPVPADGAADSEIIAPPVVVAASS